MTGSLFFLLSNIFLKLWFTNCLRVSFIMQDEIEITGRRMWLKQSEFKNYDELPLFLNAKIVAQVLGISAAGAYELLHQEGFPVIKIGSRLVLPKEKFLSGVENQTGGAQHR